QLKHDLTARLKLRISVPGLAHRLEDVPLLVRHLAERIIAHNDALAQRFGRGEKPVAFEPALIEALLRHRYTHHLRELERLLLLAFQSSPGDYVTFTPALERELVRGPAPATTEPTSEQVEQALARAGGSATKAAAVLGLRNRYALYRLAKKYGLTLRDGA